MSDVPGSLQSWVSTIHTVVLTADVFQLLKKVEKRQLWVRPCEWLILNSQAAWYIRHVCIIRFLWTKRTIWLLILSFTQNIVRACSMLYPYEGYRSVTPLDAARVNRTIFYNHSVRWYHVTLIKRRDYIEHNIIVRHGKQNPHGRRWL